MRNFMMFLLASASAAPAIAQSDEGDGRLARAEARAARQAERAAERQVQQVERAERSADDGAAAPVERASVRETRRFERSEVVAPAERVSRSWQHSREAAQAQRESSPRRVREAGDSVRTWRQRDRYRADSPAVVEQANEASSGELRRRDFGRAGRDADGPRIGRDVPTTPSITGRNIRRIGSNVPIEGSAPPPPDRVALERSRTTRHWRGDWRNDRRYDWRDWRRRNRSRFHLGFYFDPFGWNYRRYSVGWRLWPSYYGSRYWLSDPWHYRLPPAYGPYRWIRYHDDALLVNIYTGEVTDVIYNFFW